jgi:cytidylate kinase
MRSESKGERWRGREDILSEREGEKVREREGVNKKRKQKFYKTLQ